MILGQKQIVELDMIYVVSLKGSCHHGFPASGMAENKAYVCLPRIETVFLVIKIRFRNDECFVWQLPLSKDITVCDQFISYKDIHFRYRVAQEFI